MIVNRLPPCPACAKPIAWSQVPVTNRFHCPHCNEWLKMPDAYLTINGGLSIVLSALLGYGLGYRGVPLLVVAAIATFPLGMFLSFAIRRIVPPPLEWLFVRE